MKTISKHDVANLILSKNPGNAQLNSAEAYAPTNIALCKYWGKRSPALNLPHNSSLSISLADKGAHTKITLHDKPTDLIFLNRQSVALDNPFSLRIIEFLALLLPKRREFFRIETDVNIPVAAGVASSACGFAALVQALNRLYHWQLEETALSILARLGSGSACRSLWHGFVEWQMGSSDDGMDSYGVPLAYQWNDLRIGLLVVTRKPKPVSSREAMARTVDTSVFYPAWLKKSELDLIQLKLALADQDFTLLGTVTEANALAMHATMQTASPAIIFSSAKTMAIMYKVWRLRKDGLAVYFTQDAGPNIKLLFLADDAETIKKYFPMVEIIAPFNKFFEWRTRK